MNKIGELISEYRKEHNVTQKELAHMLGVSNTAVSKWECGNNLPDIGMLKPLSEILGVSVLSLIDYQEEAVLENNISNKKKIKRNRIILRVCVVVIILLLISIGYLGFICRRLERENEEIKENEIAGYVLRSDDNSVSFNGYMYEKSKNAKTIINYLAFNDSNTGTTEEIYSSNVEIRIKLGRDVIYQCGFENENKKKIKLSSLVNKIKFEKTFYESSDLKLNNGIYDDIYLVIEYNIDLPGHGELIFPIKVKPIFEK